jgi:nucleoside-diphosphate-sugar epimerase
MSRVLVTGATGFIGRGLVERCVADGIALRAALRTPSPLPVETVVVGEIGPDTDWGAALQGIDAVVHLAGRAHVMRHETDALAQFRRVNAAGTARLAVQAEAAGVRRFVLVSSVKAAADTSARPLTETDPARPGTPYGISKLEGEAALTAAAHRMETVILRPPLVYGPGVAANFRALLRLVDSGWPSPLSAVSNRRSLIARDNLMDAIVVALAAPGAACGVFYVSDGEPLSTPALIAALAKALGKPARLFPMPPALLRRAVFMLGRADAADSLLGSLEIDDTAFRNATCWRPPVNPEVAFTALAAWYIDAKGRA